MLDLAVAGSATVLPPVLDFDRDREASPARMNRAMEYLYLRLAAATALQPEFESAIAELQAVGLDRLNEVLGPIFAESTAIAAQLTTIKAAWITGQPLAQLLADLEAGVTGRLSAVDAQLAANLTSVTAKLGTVDTRLAELSPAAKWAAATTDEARAGTAQRLISAAILWAMLEPVPLTDAALIAVDLSKGVHFNLPLGGNRTLAAPTNGKPGQEGFIRVVQDGTGGRALSFAAAYKFLDLATAPSLNPAASAVTLLRYQVTAAGEVFLSGGRPVSALREQTIRGHFHSNGSDYIYGTYYNRVPETVTYTMTGGQNGLLSTNANGGQTLVNNGAVGATGSITLPAGSSLSCTSTTPGQSATFHINRTL